MSVNLFFFLEHYSGNDTLRVCHLW